MAVCMPVWREAAADRGGAVVVELAVLVVAMLLAVFELEDWEADWVTKDDIDEEKGEEDGVIKLLDRLGTAGVVLDALGTTGALEDGMVDEIEDTGLLDKAGGAGMPEVVEAIGVVLEALVLLDVSTPQTVSMTVKVRTSRSMSASSLSLETKPLEDHAVYAKG